MNREVPKLQGQGDYDAAKKIANLTFWFMLLVSGVFTLIIVILALVPGLFRHHTTLLCTSLLFFAMQLYNYFQLLLKCHIRFRAMSLQQLFFALATPVVVIPLSYFWGLNGFILGQAIVALALCALIRQISPLRVGFPLQFQGSWPLARIGLPIMGAGVLYFLLTTIDRWVILKYLGTEALGQYTVAILTFGMVGLLPRVVSEQMYPRIAFQFGQTGDKQQLLPLIFRQSLMAGAVTLPVIIPLIFFLPTLVRHFLPAYVSGIPSAQILLTGAVFLPLASGIANFLNTVDKQLYYFVVQAVMLSVNVSLGIIFVKTGYGLTGVALAGAITYFLFVILLMSVCYALFNRN
jgi:O-antigen/teichoic acid export membrane protein